MGLFGKMTRNEAITNNQTLPTWQSTRRSEVPECLKLGHHAWERKVFNMNSRQKFKWTEHQIDKLNKVLKAFILAIPMPISYTSTRRHLSLIRSRKGGVNGSV